MGDTWIWEYNPSTSAIKLENDISVALLKIIGITASRGVISASSPRWAQIKPARSAAKITPTPSPTHQHPRTDASSESRLIPEAPCGGVSSVVVGGCG